MFDANDAVRVASLAAALGQAAFPDADYDHDAYLGAAAVRDSEAEAHASLLRCIFGPVPFRRVRTEPPWRTPPVLAIANSIYEDRRWEDLPILGDALQEAGCSDAALLEHCRAKGPHTRGCWLVDLLLKKE